MWRKAPVCAGGALHRRLLPNCHTISFRSSSTAYYTVNNQLFVHVDISKPGQQDSLPASSSVASSESQSEVSRSDVVNYFREWFMSRKKPLFDRIFEILRTEEESAGDAALSRLNFQVSEALILDVLDYQKEDVLSCLKFFDWAGRQPGFYHTRATFNAIFRIISKGKLMRMLEFLQNDMEQRYKVSYHSVLVIGYAAAGKPETALHLFGKMRFMGLDLDAFAYHVLLNSLVEQGHFDVVETVAREIRVRGFQNEVTHSIMVKNFSKQKDFERCTEYLRALVQNDSCQLSGIAIQSFIDALCKDNQFERAAKFVEEFQGVGLVSMDYACGVWLRGLVKAGKLDEALDFLKDKEAMEGYVPDVFRYNMLICRLLRENRIEEVYDLLMDMKEKKTLPDDVTMNAVLCFLCKAGRMDVAMDLYELRSDFGLSVNFMAYNYLINSLLGDVSVDEAYRVLRKSIDQGYLPGQKTFAIIADSLGREGKLDKMKELVLFTLERGIMLNTLTYDECISALCRAGRVEEGYAVHGSLNSKIKIARKNTYRDLVIGLSKSNRGDIAARLLVEMQERGYRPSRILVREVISSLSRIPSLENHIFRLLKMQLDRHQSSDSVVYNIFIDAAGHAKHPKVARQIYDMMIMNGIKPKLKSNILLLRSYLKGNEIDYALHLFRDLVKERRNRKLWHTMIVGLCKAQKPEHASKILNGMKAKELRPSIECYEELTKLYCDLGQYHKAIYLVNDMTQLGRPVPSFIGNVFLLHALRTRKVYAAWDDISHKEELTSACSMLGYLIGAFSGSIEGDYDAVELGRLIQECFHVTMYTNNMLLRRLSMSGTDLACQYFYRLREKGYKPNKWTYDIIVHSFIKEGRTAEARTWSEKMLHEGFLLTEAFVLELRGVYGDGKFKWYPYTTIVLNFSQMWALYCLVQFYNVTHQRLEPIKPLAKVISFKAIVFATWWQGVGIVLLAEFRFLPKEGEFQTGLQDFLICIEMAIAAVAHIFVFSAKLYHFLPASEFGNITTRETTAMLKIEEGDVEKQPTVIEKKETEVEAPGTSVKESVEDIVVEGGQKVVMDVVLTINQAVHEGVTKIQETFHKMSVSGEGKEEAEVKVEEHEENI